MGGVNPGKLSSSIGDAEAGGSDAPACPSMSVVADAGVVDATFFDSFNGSTALVLIVVVVSSVFGSGVCRMFLILYLSSSPSSLSQLSENVYTQSLLLPAAESRFVVAGVPVFNVPAVAGLSP